MHGKLMNMLYKILLIEEKLSLSLSSCRYRVLSRLEPNKETNRSIFLSDRRVDPHEKLFRDKILILH